jgi:hypothetical protein
MEHTNKSTLYGKMQSFITLEHVLHIVTAGIKA